jgi:hypothetical protein
MSEIYNKYLYYIIIIQKNYRKYYNSKRINITKSHEQTKQWRKNEFWYINGKKNECEIYQRNNIKNITKKICEKTIFRLNIYTYEFLEKKYPYSEINGFEWTEDFDGFFENNMKKYYFNLKFICHEGGAQRRTLCLVYHFIYVQLNYIKKYNHTNIFFINILDGDFSYKNLDKMKYILTKQEFNNVSKYIFIGDTYSFQNWWIKNN